MKTDLEKLEKLDDLVTIQATDGNWNYNEYMRGLLNGLLIARSIFDNKEPDLKEQTTCLADMEMLELFNKSGVVLDE